MHALTSQTRNRRRQRRYAQRLLFPRARSWKFDRNLTSRAVPFAKERIKTSIYFVWIREDS